MPCLKMTTTVVEVLTDTEVKAVVMISISIERKEGARNITKSTSLENTRIIEVVRVVDLVHTHTLHIHPLVVLVPDRDQQNGAAQNIRRENHINIINVADTTDQIAEAAVTVREKIHLTLLMLMRLVRLCND